VKHVLSQVNGYIVSQNNTLNRKVIRFALILGLLHTVLLAPAALHAQNTDDLNHPWTFRNRLIMTGSSDHSDPTGYMVFSAITFGLGLGFRF